MVTLNQFKFRLAMTLQYILASENLLSMAAERDAGLRDYFLRHLEEERHHAKWLEEDLGDYKLPVAPLPAAMAGTMYYLVLHVSTKCLLGYMLALEKIVSMHEVELAEQAFGKELLRTVRLHAEEDPAHEGDLLKIIESLPEDDKRFVGLGFEWTQSYLISLEQSALQVPA